MNMQFNDGPRFVEVDFNLTGFCVFGDVIKRFLADAVEGDLNLAREVERPANGDRYREVGAP